jgi:hypothetical protein
VRHDPRRRVEPRDAKVEHLGLRRIARGEEHVRRLDVAVDHALAVREDERAEDPRRDGDGLLRGDAAAGEARAEVLAFEPLHREVRLAVLGDPAVDVADDGRVREVGERAHLAAEPLRGLLLGASQHLDGDDGAREPVVRAVHDAHPAGSGLGNHLEAIRQDLTTTHCVRMVASGSRREQVDCSVYREAASSYRSVDTRGRGRRA